METINTMNQNPAKAVGMPFGVKILLIIFGLGFGLFLTYSVFIYKPEPTPIVVQAPAEKSIFHKGEVIVAKSKDFKDIRLYLVSDVTMNDYSTILRAVASIPSTVLVVPSQEVTFNSAKAKLMVYKCQIASGVLMGKVVSISKKPM